MIPSNDLHPIWNNPSAKNQPQKKCNPKRSTRSALRKMLQSNWLEDRKQYKDWNLAKEHSSQLEE